MRGTTAQAAFTDAYVASLQPLYAKLAQQPGALDKVTRRIAPRRGAFTSVYYTSCACLPLRLLGSPCLCRLGTACVATCPIYCSMT